MSDAEDTKAFFARHPVYAEQVLALARKLEGLVKASGLSHIACSCCNSATALSFNEEDGEFHIGFYLTPEKDIAKFEVANGRH